MVSALRGGMGAFHSPARKRSGKLVPRLDLFADHLFEFAMGCGPAGHHPPRAERDDHARVRP
jgi:hypothetical protein